MGFNVKVIMGGFIGFFQKKPIQKPCGFYCKILMGGFIGVFLKNPSEKNKNWNFFPCIFSVRFLFFSYRVITYLYTGPAKTI